MYTYERYTLIYRISTSGQTVCRGPQAAAGLRHILRLLTEMGDVAGAGTWDDI